MPAGERTFRVSRAACCGLGGLILALFAVGPAPRVAAAASPAVRNATPFAGLADLSRSFEDLAAAASPAVVQIFASGYGPGESHDSEGLLGHRRSSGSGVILDPEGVILTNAHVVEGAERVQVLLGRAATAGSPHRSIVRQRGMLVDATVLGLDRETDLAVISVGERGLPSLDLGDSDDLRSGEIVLALGSPLGLENSVTMGVVSAVARQVRPDDRVVYIQTDAPINPGNSGGPLIDTEGRVVGINTFILSQSGGSEGVGFAVPSNIARNVYEQIRKTGHVRRGMIGISTQTITPELATGLGLERDWGVVIADVHPNGPGHRSGLQVGDIIVTLDEKPMENSRQFTVNLYRRTVGESVRLGLLRGVTPVTVRVPVLERKDDPGRFAMLVDPERNVLPRIGILGIDLEPRVLALLPPLRRNEGVLVAGWTGRASVGAEGLQSGDIIHALNTHPITNLDSLRAATSDLPEHHPAVLQIERDGQFLYVVVELR